MNQEEQKQFLLNKGMGEEYSNAAVEINNPSIAFSLMKVEEATGKKHISYISRNVKETKEQFEGKDLEVTMDDGSIYFIEIKVRKKPYKDFLIELIGNNKYCNFNEYTAELEYKTDNNGARLAGEGWIYKDYKCHYLVYFNSIFNEGFMFNWKYFKETFNTHIREWSEKASWNNGDEYKKRKNLSREEQKKMAVDKRLKYGSWKPGQFQFKLSNSKLNKDYQSLNISISRDVFLDSFSEISSERYYQTIEGEDYSI